MKSLYEQLVEYNKSDAYPFHMPGHKRNTTWLRKYGFGNIKEADAWDAYKMDITEIEDFDNLHDSCGILKESMRRAARVYGAEETNYLINGSTVGILAGIAAVTKRGDKILVARNCHKSVYHAIYLNNLNPIYLYPQIDKEWGITLGLTRDYVDNLLKKQKDIKLIVLVSPTYEGITSDILGICEAAHRRGIPVLVDEAHGAHFGFSDGFPENSVKNGADIVIHSVHKTLPAFTQSALLHRNGDLVNRATLLRYLSIYQSSSPSYVLMAGIDACMELLEKHNKEVFSQYEERLYDFYEKTVSLKNIRVMHPDYEKHLPENFGRDNSKILISVKGSSMTGMQLYDILWKEYKLQMELVSKEYVLGMTSICDSERGFERLADALFQLDQRMKMTEEDGIKWEEQAVEASHVSIELDMIMSIYEAYDYSGEWMPLEKTENKILREYIYLYPPGIPIGVPGEQINSDFIQKLIAFLTAGLEVKGCREGKIMVQAGKDK